MELRNEPIYASIEDPSTYPEHFFVADEGNSPDGFDTLPEGEEPVEPWEEGTDEIEAFYAAEKAYQLSTRSELAIAVGECLQFMTPEEVLELVMSLVA